MPAHTDLRQEALNRFPVLRYFEYHQLPSSLQSVSKPFHDLAWDLTASWLQNGNPTAPAEFATALRNLLTAKDSAVRSFLP